MQRIQKQQSVTFFLLLVFLLMGNATRSMAQVTFKASAPATVVQGEQFRLSLVLNKEGRELRLPDMPDFDILFGPSTSTSYSQRTVNGKTTSESSVTYTYVLVAKKPGTFTISEASITVDGSNYRSNPIQIKVLPPDEGSSQGGSAGARSSNESTSTGSATVSTKDAFIRAIVSKNSIFEQEGFTVTFRLYTTLNIVNFGKIQFPEFEGFMAEDIPLPANQQLDLERYNDRNYYTADLKKTLLFPQRSGLMTIPSGNIEMVFSVPSGRKVSTFFGTQEVMVDVTKNMTTNPVTIQVKPLPAGKPASYANAVGNFTLTPSISTVNTKANEAITLTLEIFGTGNMKLIRNPEVAFPDNFEQYDPVVDNALNVNSNGLNGIRKISYMVIPRYEGNYTIPPVEFSYFDLSTNKYKTITTPEYKLQIAKGDANSAPASSFVNRQDVKVEQDIRFLKTGEIAYISRTNFFVGSVAYWLWYLIPLTILLVLYLFNRKQARENANVVLMRTKKANKMAVKRLKTAGKHLQNQNKELFYDEVLRALWGYFSDKLSIPLAQLSKQNIESELSKKGINEELVGKFMHILDTCEFARYAPAEGDAAMDRVYHETLETIGEMENKLRKSVR